MMKLLQDRCVIVTGAASPRGIGLATVRALDAQGARVAIIDLHAGASEQAAASVGDRHRGYGCDVADRAAVRDTVGATGREFGRIGAAILYAGISRSTRLPDISQEEYDAVMRINVGGTMNVCQAAVPYMKEAKRGALVCIGSIAAQRGGGLFGASHYSASKGAVQSLAKALARELAPDGIRVNAIAPGLVETDIFEGKLTEERKLDIVRTIPIQRVGHPDDVAHVAVFLVSDWAAYITGAVIDVNGGAHIH